MAGARACLRPLVVRFTEPAFDDVHLALVYERDGDSVQETVRDIKIRVRAY